jgi:hypothetical protein
VSLEPTTYCTHCGDPFDVYRAPGERVCDACKEIAAIEQNSVALSNAEHSAAAIASAREILGQFYGDPQP